MARTYKRDSMGRFAGGGGSSGSRPAPRQAPKGRNRLTRDNAGRITSVGGDGAIARGGRLRTAAGNQRATQTTRIKGGGGRLRGGKASVNVQQGRGTAATTALRRGEFVRANLRPQGVMAKPRRADQGWGRTKKENLARAESIAKAEGFAPYVDTRRKAQGIASFSAFRPGKITLVKNSEYWSNPRKHSIDQRRQGWFSSSSPKAVIMHEIGHSRAKRTGFMNDPSKPWGIGTRPFDSARNQRLARRVSGYAATSPSEFIAETYAGRRTGRKYDHQVMRAYRQEMGLPPTSVRRTVRRRRAS